MANSLPPRRRSSPATSPAAPNAAPPASASTGSPLSCARRPCPLCLRPCSARIVAAGHARLAQPQPGQSSGSVACGPEQPARLHESRCVHCAAHRSRHRRVSGPADVPAERIAGCCPHGFPRLIPPSSSASISLPIPRKARSRRRISISRRPAAWGGGSSWESESASYSSCSLSA